MYVWSTQLDQERENCRAEGVDVDWVAELGPALVVLAAGLRAALIVLAAGLKVLAAELKGAGGGSEQ